MYSQEIYIAKQPIFNREFRTYAYELLFRNGKGENIANILNGEEATTQVIMNTLGEFGLNELVGEAKAFVNLTEGLLNRQVRHILPVKNVVVEVLEDVHVTPALIRRLKELRSHGFTIALDDYIFHPELQPLEDVADLIKVDILQAGPRKLIEHTQRLKNKGIRLLAEKVETEEQYLFCHRLGYDYFQGYFFAKPKIVEGRAIPPSKLSVLELLSKLNDPDVSLVEVSQVISKDVALSEKLIKFLGGMQSEKLHSVHDAVLRFGLKRLQCWGGMLVLTMLEDKPPELFRTALVRATFCELIGEKIGQPAKETYYTVGLFSTLEAMMDVPLEQLLAQMKLSSDVEAALLSHKGPLGQVLQIVLTLEQGKVPESLPDGITSEDISQAMLKAMQTAQKMEIEEK
ncbi:EAL and HDOD domain-containing protein [Galenea microaerophila]